MRLRRFIFSIVSALCGVSASLAQIQVEQRLDSLEIPIGEQTQLHLSVTMKRGTTAQLPSFEPSQMMVPGIEVVEQQDADTADMGNGVVRICRSYTLTSFDEKLYAIPPLKVKVGGKSYQGNTLALKVLAVEVDTIHPNQYFPPKDVQDNPFSWDEWKGIFWLSILLVILCGVTVYLFDRLKRNKPVIAKIRIVKKELPHQVAMKEINAIKQNHPDTQEGQKEYYTRLTDALRRYIERRFGFSAMEMTSAEIIDRLRENSDQTMLDELTELFQTADLVKFAKYQTLINENDMNLVNAVQFIDKTKQENLPTEERIVPQLTDDEKKSVKGRIAVKSVLIALVVVIVALIVCIVYRAGLLLI